MCFDKERFIDEDLVGDLICSICQCVLCCPQISKNEPVSKQEPIRGTEGGHKFCEKCISGWLKNNHTCPDCRKVLYIQQLQPLDRSLINVLKKLQVRCKYYEKGCKHVDRLELIEKHESDECAYERGQCKKCGSPINQGHSEKDCNDKLIDIIKTKENEIQNRNKRIETLGNEINRLNNRIETKENELQKMNSENALLKTKETKLNEKITQLQDELNKMTNIVNQKACNAKIIVHTSEIVNLCKNEENYNIVKEMIEDYNVDVNYKDKQGWTALITATQEGNLNLVKLLINKGADVNHKDNIGSTPLMIASNYGYLQIVKLLIEKDASNLDEKDKSGWTALIYASNNGYLEVVRFLTGNGANVNIQNDEGETAIILAKNRGHTDIVYFLSLNGVF